LANSKKTKTIDFEKELAEFIVIVHRRQSGNISACKYSYQLVSNYKKGTRYSDICEECLKSYSMEEIKLLKHFLIVQKLKGN